MSMPIVRIILNGDDALKNYVAEGWDIIHGGSDFKVGGLTGGMASGKPSVFIAAELPEKRLIFLETSLAMFLTVADGLKAKYGDPRE